jgi:hypothetical protein
MKAAGTSETSANFYQTTQRNIPEDIRLHAAGCKDLKPYFCTSSSFIHVAFKFHNN